MDSLNYVNPTNRDEYGINRHRKKIAAFILAIIIYILFFGPLIVDIVPESWYSPTYQQSPLDGSKNPQRIAPAPVQYMSAPRAAQPAQQPQQPTPAQPQVQPTPPVIPQESPQEITPPEPEQPAEKKQPEPIKEEPLRDTIATLPLALQEEHISSPSIEKIPSNNIPQKRERSGRKKWFKESAQEPNAQRKEQLHTAPQNQQQSLVSQVSQGLYEHMSYEHAQRESKSFEAAVANNNDNAAHSFELNIFLNKFVKAFCDYSTRSPLFIRAESIPPHTIQFEATFSRKRKIINIIFIKESADYRVGQYIKTILSDLTTPQLPSIWKGDEITMRFSIDLTHPHPGDRIWFVPGQF